LVERLVEGTFLFLRISFVDFLSKSLRWNVRLEVLAVVTMKFSVSWDVTSCTLLGRYQRFIGIYFHLTVSMEGYSIL
jgi:hypothetical protein